MTREEKRGPFSCIRALDDAGVPRGRFRVVFRAMREITCPYCIGRLQCADCGSSGKLYVEGGTP